MKIHNKCMISKVWVAIAQAFLLLLAAPITSCSDPATLDEPALEAGGSAQLAISGTQGVYSVLAIFAGSKRTSEHCIPVDGETNTRIDGLPTGTVLVSAAAFASVDCSDDPTWRMESQTKTFVAGEVTSIRFVFRPNGIALINDEYIPDEHPLPTCGSAGWERVPRAAMAVNPNGPLGTGLLAVYDDGDERYEGPLDFGPYQAGGSAPSHYPADVLANETSPTLWKSIWGLGGETLTGYIVAPRTGTVEFSVTADDYAVLELGESGELLSLLVDHTGGASGTAELTAGNLYAVKLRYMNRVGSNWLRFYWSCPVE